MSPELIRLTKKTEPLKEVLAKHGFEELEYFWYCDGYYSSNWNNMSVANEKPETESHMALWQFGFKGSCKGNPRLKLEAIMPIFEDYFRIELKYYPNITLHDRKGYMGPVPILTVSDILEQDLANIQKFIDFLVNL